jgi:hypothetical protein
MTCHIFVGPTAFGIPEDVFDETVELHSPAARGDLPALVPRLSKDDCVALVDGRFGDVMSVSHRDILCLLADDIPVWGLSSMGAIRVAEMERYGMRPFGQVAARFIADPSFPDDEVTLVHLPSAPYAPVSEPMIHLERYLINRTRTGLIKEEIKDQALARLRSLWFGYRDWQTLDLILSQLGVPESDRHVTEDDKAISRIKTFDLKDFLHEKPWSS